MHMRIYIFFQKVNLSYHCEDKERGIFFHILEQKALSSCLDGPFLTLTTCEKFVLVFSQPMEIIGQKEMTCRYLQRRLLWSCSGLTLPPEGEFRMWGRRPILTSCYGILWYGMVWWTIQTTMYGMVGHADPPTPQIWAANMCHIHGGPVYTTQPTREWRRGAFSKRNLKVAELICVILHTWWDRTYIHQPNTAWNILESLGLPIRVNIWIASKSLLLV